LSEQKTSKNQEQKNLSGCKLEFGQSEVELMIRKTSKLFFFFFWQYEQTGQHHFDSHLHEERVRELPSSKQQSCWEEDTVCKVQSSLERSLHRSAMLRRQTLENKTKKNLPIFSQKQTRGNAQELAEQEPDGTRQPHPPAPSKTREEAYICWWENDDKKAETSWICESHLFSVWKTRNDQKFK
jgi:hypothetical protein